MRQAGITLKQLWREQNFEPNDNQERAILHTDGPLFLPAGSGSGKAKVQYKKTTQKNGKKVTRYTHEHLKEPRTPETGHTRLLPADEMEKQVVSKYRVTTHGEVFTRKREVNAMLDLVKQETERIESRFLEPACGVGNFLTEILERKLRIVKERYRKSQLEFERNAVLAISSIYGIDILQDNVEECRKRLLGIFDCIYSSLYNETAKNECRKAVRFILERNIIWGDALTLKTVGDPATAGQPIVFSEWSPVNGSMLKRRDFTFHNLLHESLNEPPVTSDLGEEVFIPRPQKEYPLIRFLEIGDVEQA